MAYTPKIISYDLGGPETSASYRKLAEFLSSISSDYIKPLESYWIINTDWSCVEIRDATSKYLDSNDKLLVVDCPKIIAAWKGLDGSDSQWLHRH